MKLKHLIVTVVLLASLSVGAYFATRTTPPLSSDPRVGQPLVSPESAEKAAKLKISDQGKMVVLARQPDGSWTVPAYYDFPADFQKLSGFVSDVTTAKIEQLVTTNPQRLSHLEFKDTQIAFLNSKDAAQLTLTLGKTADAGGRFVRFDNEEKGYRTNLSAWIDADPKSWANPAFINLKPEDVAKVEIDFSDSPAVVATRPKKDDPFVTASAPANSKLAAEKITSLISSLTGLRFTDTTAPSDPNAIAAQANQRSVILTTFDGRAITVALGRKPEQKIIKAPTAKPDGKSGPAALGKIVGASTDHVDQGPAKALAPETETIPAGPVFAFVKSSDEKAGINAMMKTRAFQVYESSFSSLPQKPEELFEPLPAPQAALPKPNVPAAP